MEKHLLFPTTTPIEHNNLISEIHQSIIDLQWDPPENEIQVLLKDSLSFLDKNLDEKTTNKIFDLIFECFSHIQSKKRDFVKELYENSKKNSNRLILFSLFCTRNDKEFNNSQVKPLITDISKQILKYIKSNNKNLVIFNHGINQNYKNDFIYNIVSRIKTSEKLVSSFYTYLLTQNTISKEKSDILFQKVINSNLITSFSEDILADDRYFNKFTFENVISMLNKITTKKFTKILTLIQSTFQNKRNWTSQKLMALFDKCVEFKVDFSFIRNQFFFELFDLKQMKPSYWKYFFLNEVSLPYEFIRNIENFSNQKEALYLIKNYENIPIDVIAQGLLEIDDTFVYDRLLEYDFEDQNSIIISGKNFWIHIFITFSLSKEKYTKPLYKPFVQMFERYVKIDNAYEYIEAMIFSLFPTTETRNQFLFDFLNNLSFDYKETFNQNRIILLTLISDMKVFPLPSFWNIFDHEFMEQFFEGEVELNDPVMLYAYYFVNIKFKSIENFMIQPFTDEKSVTEFIKRNDLNYMTNMNTDSIFLIIAALIYTMQEVKPEIVGLTKFNILPFLAISFNFLSSEKSDTNFQLTEEMKYLLIDASKYLVLADKVLMNVSVNSILINLDHLFKIEEEIALEILEIFIDQFIDNLYTADEIILLKVVFKLQNLYSKNKKVQLFFDKYRFILFERILKIEDFSQFKDVKFNLKIFDEKKVLSTLIKQLQINQSYNEVMNSIYIILNSDFVIPNLEKIVHKMDLSKLFQKAMFRKKTNDLNALSHFKILFNAPSIAFDLYSKSNSKIYNINFDFLISKSITNEFYFETLFEKICLDFTVKPKTILEKYFDMYNNHSESFLRSLSSSFAFNSDKKIFVKLLENSSSFDSKSMFEIKYFVFLNLSKKTNNYNDFLMLNKLLSTFPFIFEENDIERIFDSIFPALDNFGLYFTIENESDKKDVNLLKVSVSAFYCLYKFLYLPKILDLFFNYLFKNYLSFTPSQTFSITYILLSLLSTEKVKNGMLAFSSKLGFSKILNHLHQIKVPIEFSSYFNENTFQLTNLYYNAIFDLTDSQNYYLEGLKNSTPFQRIFNHFHTIYPTKLTPIQLPKVANNEIKKFIEKSNIESTFSIHYDHPSIEISEKQIDNFIDHYNRINGNGNDKFNDKSYCTYVKYIDDLNKLKYYSANYDDWVFRSLTDKDFKFPKTESHIRILEMLRWGIYSYNKINNDVFFKKDFNNLEFAYFMINDTRYSKIIEKMIKNQQGINLFSKSIKKYGNYLENYKQIKEYFITILNRETCYNDSFEKVLISFSLSKEMRKDIPFLKKVSMHIKGSLYSYYNNQSMVGRLELFICFLLSIKNDDEISSIAFDLLDEFRQSFRSTPILKQLIERLFEREISKKNPSATSLMKLIHAYPDILSICDVNIPLILENYLMSYNSDISDKWKMIEVICTLFNKITPARIEDQNNTIKEEESIDFNESVYKSTVDEENGLSQVPHYLVDLNPTFWNLYIKHRKIINEIVNESSEIYADFKFLRDYPELMSFNNRINLFRKSIPEIKEYDSISLDVSRSRVLTDSFEQLSGISRDQWLTSFNVHFRNERGIDAGGLTKDWFSLITKEIFNPNFALFTLTENQTYQPNPSSGVNSQHIEYFNFIGKVIARSLIQRQYVKCHFSRSFIRQILQVPLKLKDLEDYDANIYNSMNSILQEDVEPLCLNFSIDIDDFGQMKTILLKDNGDEIDVTNDNKREYVTLYTNYKLRKSIINQVKAFCEGFYFLIPHEKIKLFSPSELDLMICGIPDVDIDDLRRNTEYTFPYNNDHPLINMFFNVISEWSRDDLAKFLLFVTGSSQVPLNGFKEYKDKGKAITISPGGEKERLCVAHTCFNTLDLPLYESEEELNRKLLMSIQELEFGIG